MVLSAQSIRKAGVIKPFHERTIHMGMSFGLGPNGYDVRIAESIIIPPKGCVLASTVEYFEMPDNLMARVADKSTWARRFLSIFNTTIDAGWKGYLTLELVNNGDSVLKIDEGSPIAKIVFECLDEPTELLYDGGYQDQRQGGQPAKDQDELPGLQDDGPLFNAKPKSKPKRHKVRIESDEYACSCGARWDKSEGDKHP